MITSKVYETAIQTPLEFAKNLSLRYRNNVYLKREDLQPVFSFKLRGAYNKISKLSKSEQEQGLIASSAGNHAQGVAYSARHLGLSALIIMPRTTPKIKVNAVLQLGAEVELAGDNYSETVEYCNKRIQETGRVFIPPYDDIDIITGQGTIGHELLLQLSDLNIVLVPVGGGGLISGIAAFIKQLKPEVKIIGVEPTDSNAMTKSLQNGERVYLNQVGIFADGVAVKQVGELTFELCKQYVDDMVNVTTDEISFAIKSIYEDTRSIMEPAGALAVAGLRKYVKQNKISGQNIVAINSGANMNFDRLQFVAELTGTGSHHEGIYAVTIPEKPGSLRHFCEKMLGDKNITEFNYRYTPGEEAHIFVGLEIGSETERFNFCKEIENRGFPCLDLTDNELAKIHIRHMVGGRSVHTRNESLYRFQFPERPGALSHFLNSLPATWNISLFHYRMHGGDFGRVLIGLDIPQEEKSDFQEFVDRLNYNYIDESENPAYYLFL